MAAQMLEVSTSSSNLPGSGKTLLTLYFLYHDLRLRGKINKFRFNRRLVPHLFRLFPDTHFAAL